MIKKQKQQSSDLILAPSNFLVHFFFADISRTKNTDNIKEKCTALWLQISDEQLCCAILSLEHGWF